MAVKVKSKKDVVSSKASKPGDGGNIVIDMDAVNAGSGALPAGVYPLILAHAELTASRQKKTPEIKVTWTVTEGDYEGRKLWDDFYLLQSCKFRFDQFFKAAGIKKPSGQVSAAELLECFEEGTQVNAAVTADPVRDNNKIERYVSKA